MLTIKLNPGNNSFKKALSARRILSAPILTRRKKNCSLSWSNRLIIVQKSAKNIFVKKIHDLIFSNAIKDEKLGLVFSIRVRLHKNTIWIDGNHVNLSPGMAVTVEIKTKKRRVIEYFLDPLMKHTAESLHER